MACLPHLEAWRNTIFLDSISLQFWYNTKLGLLNIRVDRPSPLRRLTQRNLPNLDIYPLELNKYHEQLVRIIIDLQITSAKIASNKRVSAAGTRWAVFHFIVSTFISFLAYDAKESIFYRPRPKINEENMLNS